MRTFKILFILSFFLCVNNINANVKVMHRMVERLLPQYSSSFVFEELRDDDDVYEVETVNGMVIIRGNNANSMAVGLNHYLKQYCKTSVSWYANDSVVLPKGIVPLNKKITSKAKVKNRFFLNYCTFGYSLTWWKWRDWERFIDWMALNGINLPLSITGQEAIWYKVWTKLGFDDYEIRHYFTGPSHLPWHRMSNLDKWQGPLPKSWLENQETLQRKIVERERELNMKPVLPAFGGHVPEFLINKYPDAKISRLSRWGGFKDQYRSFFLDPMDPLFGKIQKMFLDELIKTYGTDHIYGVDPFNEVSPPDWSEDFLNKCSNHIYKSLVNADRKAVWLQMTWHFYLDRKEWTNDRVKAFLSGVPNEKLLLLDYYCEMTEVWKLTDKYFGKPYIWCYLGNFGGNTMLAGNLKEVGKRITSVYNNGGHNFSGIGSTLEALDVNPLMYDFVFENAWDNVKDEYSWIADYADRRIGQIDNNVRTAWKILLDSVYISPATLGQGTLTNSRPSLTGHGSWTTNPYIPYSNDLLLEIWKLMLLKEYNTDAYRFDIVNIGRQFLGNLFFEKRGDFTNAYKNKDLERLKSIGNEMKGIINDMDTLLATNHYFLLGKWIDDAKSMGKDDNEKIYYERNAKNIISTWGDKNQTLNDYANRSLAGMMKTYYGCRWDMFIDRVIESVKSKVDFDYDKFKEDAKQFEYNWWNQTYEYSKTPVGDSYDIASFLVRKYQ